MARSTNRKVRYPKVSAAARRSAKRRWKDPAYRRRMSEPRPAQSQHMKEMWRLWRLSKGKAA